MQKNLPKVGKGGVEVQGRLRNLNVLVKPRAIPQVLPHSAILGCSVVRLGPQPVTFIPENPSISQWCANPTTEGKRTETWTKRGHSGAPDVRQETLSTPSRNRSNGCIWGMDFLGSSPKTKGCESGLSRAGSGREQPQGPQPQQPAPSAESARHRAAHTPEVFGDPHPPGQGWRSP